MAAKKIFCNVELLAIGNWLRDRWNGSTGATLRLFRNDFEPGPESVQADFLEANFSGYTPQLLEGQLSDWSKIENGFYQSVATPKIFLPPATGPGNMIYGVFVLYGGEAVAANRFDEPLPMETGGSAFSVRLKINVKSESLFISEP